MPFEFLRHGAKASRTIARQVWLLALVLNGFACTSKESTPVAGVPTGADEPYRSPNSEPYQVVTADGQVLGADRVSPGDQLARNIRVGVGRDHEVIDLAPGWYLDRKGLRFAPHERVQVRGIRQTYDGGTRFIAREVIKGGRTILLRDELGRPVWEISGDGGTAEP